MARPVRVAILSGNYWPEQIGCSQVMTEFAEFLASRGLDVRVATGMPQYPQWSIWPEYRGRLWRSERRNGVRIFRSWNFARPDPSTFSRILQELSMAVFAVPTVIRALRGADRCYVLIPSLTYAFTSSVMARLLRVPPTTVVHDIMPDTAIELGMLRNPMLVRISRYLARAIYAMSNEVHTLSTAMQSRICQSLPHAIPVRVVPITIDAEELTPVPGPKNEFVKQFSQGKFTVVYSGNIGQKQDLDVLLRAADRLRDDSGVHFHVFGDGACKSQFVARITELSLTNVSLYPLQPRRMLSHMLSGADVVFVGQRPEVVDVVIPSKIMTAMAAGAMIVTACARDSETAQLLEQNCAGVVLDAGDDDGLARVIRDVCDGRIESAAYRNAARQTATARFDRRVVYDEIVSELEGAVATAH